MAGGTRAKALIAWNENTNEVRSGQMQLGAGYDYWLMNFDNVSKNGDHGIQDKTRIYLDRICVLPDGVILWNYNE